MTFLEALKAHRPMRRPWFSGDAPWLYLGEEPNFGSTIPVWRRIDTGQRVGLRRRDYEATDWEVQP